MDAALNVDRARYRAEIERSIAFSGRSHDFFLRAKVERLLALCERELGPAERLRLLDVGCGVGLLDRLLAARCGRLIGCDVAPRAVAAAAAAAAGAAYCAFDGRRAPLRDGAVDAAFATNVLHHVHPADRAAFVTEMGRTVRPGGLVVLFEHNPLHPLTRLAVRRCPLDADARLLRRAAAERLLRAAGLRLIERRYILFLPADGAAVRRLEGRIGWLPLGAQYYCAGRRPTA